MKYPNSLKREKFESSRNIKKSKASMSQLVARYCSPPPTHHQESPAQSKKQDNEWDGVPSLTKVLRRLYQSPNGGGASFYDEKGQVVQGILKFIPEYTSECGDSHYSVRKNIAFPDLQDDGEKSQKIITILDDMFIHKITALNYQSDKKDTFVPYDSLRYEGTYTSSFEEEIVATAINFSIYIEALKKVSPTKNQFTGKRIHRTPFPTLPFEDFKYSRISTGGDLKRWKENTLYQIAKIIAENEFFYEAMEEKGRSINRLYRFQMISPDQDPIKKEVKKILGLPVIKDIHNMWIIYRKSLITAASWFSSTLQKLLDGWVTDSEDIRLIMKVSSRAGLNLRKFRTKFDVDHPEFGYYKIMNTHGIGKLTMSIQRMEEERLSRGIDLIQPLRRKYSPEILSPRPQKRVHYEDDDKRALETPKINNTPLPLIAPWDKGPSEKDWEISQNDDPRPKPRSPTPMPGAGISRRDSISIRDYEFVSMEEIDKDIKSII